MPFTTMKIAQAMREIDDRVDEERRGFSVTAPAALAAASEA